MPILGVFRKNIKNGETSVQETVAYVEYPGMAQAKVTAAAPEKGTVSGF